MPKQKIVVEVEYEESRPRPGESEPRYDFVSMKVEGQSANMLPTDKPAPRRLAQDLAKEAARVAAAGVEPMTTEDVLAGRKPDEHRDVFAARLAHEEGMSDAEKTKFRARLAEMNPDERRSALAREPRAAAPSPNRED